MEEKGLVQERKQGTKTEYVMAHPEHIYSLVEAKRATLEQQAKQLESIIPLLIAKQADSPTLEVLHQHGMEGVKVIMNMAFRSKSKHWDIIAPYQNFLREYDPEYAEQYLRTRKVRGITARTLWEIPPGGRRLTEEERAERNPRIMPEALQGKFSSMLILFDDKVAIFSSHTSPSAILITSPEIHAMFMAMFEGLWDQSAPY
jgi:sugar-specific transcriptional regulator TrmB